MAYRLLTSGVANPVPQLYKIGTATIISGQTSVVVNHGLSALPSMIEVTPDCNISSVGESTFTISIPYAPVANTIFKWVVSPSSEYLNTGSLDGGSP